MLHAIAIDDEPKALDVLTLHCEKVPFLTLSATFREPVKGLAWLSAHPVDLVFLDINMPDISGLELSRLFDNDIMVVFTTAYSEHAVESYRLQALDYLVKPIRFERFLQAAQRAYDMWQLRQQHVTETDDQHVRQPQSLRTLFVKSGAKHHRINPDAIRFIEKEGNYAVFHLPGKKIVTRHTIQQLLELLPPQGFLRVHKSYIVATSHIDVVEAGQLKIGTESIPVARKYRDAVLKLTEGQ